MAFTYGPKGDPIQVPDANPVLLHHLSLLMGFLSGMTASGDMPAPLKAEASKKLQDASQAISELNQRPN